MFVRLVFAIPLSMVWYVDDCGISTQEICQKSYEYESRSTLELFLLVGKWQSVSRIFLRQFAGVLSRSVEIEYNLVGGVEVLSLSDGDRPLAPNVYCMWASCFS